MVASNITTYFYIAFYKSDSFFMLFKLTTVHNKRIHKYETRQKDDLHVSDAKKSKMKNSIRIKGVKL